MSFFEKWSSKTIAINIKDNLNSPEEGIPLRYMSISRRKFSYKYAEKFSRCILAALITAHTPHCSDYYRNNENVVSQSFCTVSESLRHDPVSILAHLHQCFRKL
nr:unnamed protein product [Callosobruchus analis]